jgi:hypothetical protein
MRKIVVLIVIVLVPFSVWFARHKKNERNAQAIRDQTYQSSLLRFQAALPLGIDREGVVRYLDSHGLVYVPSSKDVLVKIGEEPGEFPICKKWVVYVSLRFNYKTLQVEPKPQDDLGSIAIQKIGVCL